MRWLLASLIAVFGATTATAGMLDPFAGRDPRAERLHEIARRYGFPGEIFFADRQGMVVRSAFDNPTPTAPVPRSRTIRTFRDYGRDRWNGKPGPAEDRMEPGMRWLWASVTKQVTAVLVLRAVERGRIALDAPVTRYLPDFEGPSGSAVTIRMLLQHRSGLPDPNDDPAAYRPGSTEGDVLRLCAGSPKAAPDSAFRYNNCDYHLLGSVLEKVEGRSFARQVELLAHELGSDMRVWPARGPVRLGWLRGKPVEPLSLAAFGSAGAITGPLDDLSRFDGALLEGKLLKPETRALMWTGRPQDGFAAMGQWVFDARLKGCPAAVRIVERRGAIGGIGVRNILVPDTGQVLIIFSADGAVDFGEIWQGKGLSFDLLSEGVCGERRRA